MNGWSFALAVTFGMAICSLASRLFCLVVNTLNERASDALTAELPEHWSGDVYLSHFRWVGEATYDGTEATEAQVSITYASWRRSVAVASVRRMVEEWSAAHDDAEVQS